MDMPKNIIVIKLLLILSILQYDLQAQSLENTLSETQRWQNKKENIADSTAQKLEKLLKHEYLNIGLRVQTLGNYRLHSWNAEGNGIFVEAARLKASGDIGGGFGYRLQADISETPSILDARIDYNILPEVTIAAGKYKAPFSYEELKSSGNLDLISRAQVINKLAPGRQTGIVIEGSFSSGLFGFAAGAFNKKQFDAAADAFFKESYLYVARLSTRRKVTDMDDDRFDDAYEEHFTAGVNTGYEEDRISNAHRMLVGVDLRWAVENYFLSGELIYQQDDLPRTENRSPYGYQFTAGWVFPSEQQQLVLRWDSFNQDLVGTNKSDLMIFGYNLNPTKNTRLQANYIIPTQRAAFENHQFQFLMQVDFS